MRRSIAIEALLAWAFREELWKRSFLDSFGVGSSLSQDAPRGPGGGGGGGQCYAEMMGGGIHDDALRVEQAVKDLAGMRLVLADPAVLVADMPELGPEVALGLAGYRLQLDGLVARMAQLGSEPAWQVEPADRPQRRMVRDPRSGKPLWFVAKRVRCRAGVERFFEEREVDGFDAKAQRPLPGAYRKYVWEPEPWAIFDMRHDWLAWRLGVNKVAESVGPFLTKFSVEGQVKVSLPWAPAAIVAARIERPSAKVESLRNARRSELAAALAERRRAQG
jgi:hypothetical protein